MHLKADTARNYIGMISGYLKSSNDGDELPKDIAYFVGQLSSAVRARVRRNQYGPLGKQPLRKQRRPKQQEQHLQRLWELRQQEEQLAQRIHAPSSPAEMLAIVAELVPAADKGSLLEDTLDALHLTQHTPMHGRQRREVPPGTPDPSPEQPSPKQGAARQRENDTPRKYRAGKFRAVMDEVWSKLADGTSEQGRPKGDS